MEKNSTVNLCDADKIRFDWTDDDVTRKFFTGINLLYVNSIAHSFSEQRKEYHPWLLAPFVLFSVASSVNFNCPRERIFNLIERMNKKEKIREDEKTFYSFIDQEKFSEAVEKIWSRKNGVPPPPEKNHWELFKQNFLHEPYFDKTRPLSQRYIEECREKNQEPSPICKQLFSSSKAFLPLLWTILHVASAHPERGTRLFLTEIILENIYAYVGCSHCQENIKKKEFIFLNTLLMIKKSTKLEECAEAIFDLHNVVTVSKGIGNQFFPFEKFQKVVLPACKDFWRGAGALTFDSQTYQEYRNLNKTNTL